MIAGWVLPVVKVSVKGVMGSLLMSCTPAVTEKVYCVLGCKLTEGVRMMASPPPVVLTTAGTSPELELLLTGNSDTLAPMTVLGLSPPFGRFTVAVMGMLRATPVAPLAGVTVLTLGLADSSCRSLQLFDIGGANDSRFGDDGVATLECHENHLLLINADNTTVQRHRLLLSVCKSYDHIEQKGRIGNRFDSRNSGIGDGVLRLLLETGVKRRKGLTDDAAAFRWLLRRHGGTNGIFCTVGGTDLRPNISAAKGFTFVDIVSTLQQRGLLTDESAQLVRQQIAEGKPLDDAMAGAFAPSNGSPGAGQVQILQFFSDQFLIPLVELEGLNPPKELISKFPARLLIEHRLLPVRDEGDAIVVTTYRVFDTRGLDELRLATGLELRPALAPLSEIERAAKRILGVGADTLQSMNAADDGVTVIEQSDDLDLTDSTNAAHDASIIKFVNQIMTEALESRATDVHVEPFENQLRIRYRVDGVLQEANIPPQVRKFQAAIVSRIKILSHLDIAEKRLPQDGRIRLKVAGREIDLRVSVIPMIHGEAVVLRILDRGDTILGLEHLGFSRRDRNAWDRCLDLPHGIILVTGPTGSGKTTTLYAALSKINRPI